MDYSSLLTDSRWTIIKELSKKESSPSDIAKKTGTTIANISQQIRLLEAYGIVKRKKKTSENKSGKPKTIYTISKDVLEIIVITKHFCEKKNFDLDPLQQAILNLWLNLRPEDCFYLERFLLGNDDLITKCQAIGISKINSDSYELLLITEQIDEIRRKYSNQEIKKTTQTGTTETKKIICWTHRMTEIETGLKKNEEHFKTLTNNLKPFYDQKDYLAKINNMKNEQ